MLYYMNDEELAGSLYREPPEEELPKKAEEELDPTEPVIGDGV